MGISGNLKTMVLAELLQWLSQGQKTGTLVFKGDDVEKKVFFEEGMVVSSASTAESEYLGSFLAAYGYVSDEVVNEAITRQEQEQKLIGRILVDMGAVTEEQIQQTLQLKIEETIYDLFTWEEAPFEFVDGDLRSENMVKIEMDVQWIVLEGTRRLDEWNRMKETVPSEHCVPVSLTDLEALEVEETQARILTWIDDDRSIAEISAGAHTGKFMVMQAVVEQVQAGTVKVVRPKIIEIKVEVEGAPQREPAAPSGPMPSFAGYPQGYPPQYYSQQPASPHTGSMPISPHTGAFPAMHQTGPIPTQAWPMAEAMPMNQGPPPPSSAQVGGRTLNFAGAGGPPAATATAAPPATPPSEEPPASDVAGLVRQARGCRETKVFDTAFERLKKARDLAGGSSGPVQEEETALQQALEGIGIKPSSVPKLQCDVNELMSLKISPQEGFMLTRVDGSYDIKSILKMSGGLKLLDAQVLFWKLRNSGHVSV